VPASHWVLAPGTIRNGDLGPAWPDVSLVGTLAHFAFAASGNVYSDIALAEDSKFTDMR
jgi:hypothetical protein